MSHTDTDTDAGIGRRLANARMRRGLSQGTVARLAGLDPSYVSRVETGRVQPTWRTLRRLADGMHTPMSEIVDPSPSDLSSRGPCPVSRSGRCLQDLVRPSGASARRDDDDEPFTPRQIKLIRAFAHWIRVTPRDRVRAVEILMRDLMRVAVADRKPDDT